MADLGQESLADGQTKHCVPIFSLGLIGQTNTRRYIQIDILIKPHGAAIQLNPIPIKRGRTVLGGTFDVADTSEINHQLETDYLILCAVQTRC
jgi:hypothetical protein